MIKLVKFLLLIVLIAPTSTYAAQPCHDILNENTCYMEIGCEWKSGKCTECNEVGEYSGLGDPECIPCTNGPAGAVYTASGKNNGDNKCHWMYTCDTNEQVNCEKNGDKWTCSCETCTAGGHYDFYYSGLDASYEDVTSYGVSCNVDGASIVVLKMPKNYDAFPTEEDGYLFFKNKDGVDDEFSLGINGGTARDLEIKDTGYQVYEWSWTDKYGSDSGGKVADCEVLDWKRENPTCELFKGDGALNYPFAWESKYRLRPAKYYVKKGNDIIDIFTLVTDENKPNSEPSVQYNTFYAFVDADDRTNWGKLFKCDNPTEDGKCTYDLYADDWQPWPYTNFVIYFDGDEDKVLIENAGTEGYWNIGLGFNFNEAFTYCDPGYYLPSDVRIEDVYVDDEVWWLEETIPDGGVLKIVPPYGRNFIGNLTIAADGTNECPAGYYCNNCSKNKCPTAFTSDMGASEAQHCYINPNVKFTDSSGMFELPSCTGSGCVGGKIKVNYNPDLKLQ